MALVFRIPGYLREFTEGRGSVEIPSGATDLGQALERLWAIHPGVRDRVVTEQGELRPHVNLFLGTESVRHTGGLRTPVPESGEIWIVPAVSGG